MATRAARALLRPRWAADVPAAPAWPLRRFARAAKTSDPAVAVAAGAPPTEASKAPRSKKAPSTLLTLPKLDDVRRRPTRRAERRCRGANGAAGHGMWGPTTGQAYKAGGPEASKCTLILTEGDSAKVRAESAGRALRIDSSRPGL